MCYSTWDLYLRFIPRCCSLSVIRGAITQASAVKKKSHTIWYLLVQVYLRHLLILDKDETKKEEIKVEITNTGTCAIHTYIRKFLRHRLPPSYSPVYFYIHVYTDTYGLQICHYVQVLWHSKISSFWA